MNFGTVLLLFAFTAVLVRNLLPNYARIFPPWVPATLVTVAFGQLLYSFLAFDLSLAYVHQYTSTTTELAWRIAGTWTGREGSLLLWVMYLTILGVIIERRNFSELSKKIFGILTAGFLAALILHNPFEATSQNLLAARPNGFGFNPTLKNWFILIHPPIMFFAYALSFVPLASAWSAQIQKIKGVVTNWTIESLQFVRVMWLLYTLAIALGGAWAYETLGFGGFWAWDPVEVANLLPWLAATALLHPMVRGSRAKDVGFAASILLALPAIFTLVSTISTRSGLWVSVHAFTDPSNSFNPDAAARAMKILELDPKVGVYLSLLFGAMFVTLALWGGSSGGRRILDAPNYMLAGVGILAPAWLLGGWLTVAQIIPYGFGLLLLGVIPILLAGRKYITQDRPQSKIQLTTIAAFALLISLQIALVIHLTSVNGWNEAFWVSRLPFMMVPLYGGLGFFLSKPIKNKLQRIAILASPIVTLPLGVGVFAAAGVVVLIGLAILRLVLINSVSAIRLFGSIILVYIAFSFPRFWGIGLPQYLVAIPLLISGIVSTVIAYFLIRKSTPFPAKNRGQVLVILHLGVTLIFAGYVSSIYFGTEDDLVLNNMETHFATEGAMVTRSEFKVTPANTATYPTLLYQTDLRSYYPIPGITHSWWGDSYTTVTKVCLDDAVCAPGSRVVQPFDFRAPMNPLDQVTGLEIRHQTLPGVSLIWTGVVLLLACSAKFILAEEKRVES